jgi:hypothetical protein
MTYNPIGYFSLVNYGRPKNDIEYLPTTTRPAADR